MNYSKLRAYLFNQYKLTIPQDTSLDELCNVVDETRMEGQGVQWILVNALRHLDDKGLKELRDSITARIEHDY